MEKETGLGLLIVWLLFGRYKVWLAESNAFHIKAIEIHGNELLTRQEILQMVKIEEGISTWSVNLEQAVADLNAHPFLDDARIHRVHPDKMIISIKEKKPIALLNVNHSFLCIDKNGIILPSKPGKLYDLPVLSGKFKGNVDIGHQTGGVRVWQGLHLLQTILLDRPKVYNQISEIVLGRPEGVIVYTSQKGVPVRLGVSDIKLKIRYLDAILNELGKSNELKNVKYIDLRFNNQIIVGKRT